MSDRTFSNHPYNSEKFRRRQRGKGPTKTHRQQPNLNEIKDRVSQDIVRVTRQKGGGIYAHNIKDAIDRLARWLSKHSKRVIEIAFRNLVNTKIYRYNEDELRYDLMAA